MLGGPRPEPTGLENEDNYTIEVWDREGGELIGVCLRTSLWSIQCQGWTEAVKAYPGHYLVRKNGHFVVGRAAVPSATDAEATGWNRAREIALEDLPQWFGLVARCSCGNVRNLDRYAPPISKWKSYYLTSIEAKLSCRECVRAGRSGAKIELGVYKLPR